MINQIGLFFVNYDLVELEVIQKFTNLTVLYLMQGIIILEAQEWEKIKVIQ